MWFQQASLPWSRFFVSSLSHMIESEVSWDSEEKPSFSKNFWIVLFDWEGCCVSTLFPREFLSDDLTVFCHPETRKDFRPLPMAGPAIFGSLLAIWAGKMRLSKAVFSVWVTECHRLRTLGPNNKWQRMSLVSQFFLNSWLAWVLLQASMWEVKLWRWETGPMNTVIDLLIFSSGHHKWICQSWFAVASYTRSQYTKTTTRACNKPPEFQPSVLDEATRALVSTFCCPAPKGRGYSFETFRYGAPYGRFIGFTMIHLHWLLDLSILIRSHKEWLHFTVLHLLGHDIFSSCCCIGEDKAAWSR